MTERKISRTILILFLTFAVAQVVALKSSVVFANAAAETNLQKPIAVANAGASSAPYMIGERLVYNVTFADYPTAAIVETNVAPSTSPDGRPRVELRAHVETLGTVNAALFAINKDYSSIVETASGALGGDASSYDLLSALFRIRALPLATQSAFQINARSDAGQIYLAEVRVTGRATVKTAAGSFRTLVAQVRVKNNAAVNRMDVRAYFTDDERHTPVLITARVANSDIRAEIVTIEQPPPVINDGAPVAALPQPTATPAAPRLMSAPRARPFAAGEQLNYNIFLGETAAQLVGSASLQVRPRANYFGRDGLLLTGVVETNDVGAKLFTVRDEMNSYVDAASLLPYRSELHLREGSRRADSILNFDQDRGTATLVSGAKIETPVGTYDYLSALYALRSFDLTPPKRNALALFLNNRPHIFYIAAVSRDTISLNNQRVSAIQLAVTTDAPNPDKNQLRLWVSADKRRLPLRMSAMTPLGRIRADLAIIPLNVQ